MELPVFVVCFDLSILIGACVILWRQRHRNDQFARLHHGR